MSYEYKDAAKNALYMAYALTRIPSEQIEQAYDELDHVYEQAAKADEYEAKAKAFDLIVAEDKSNFSCGDFCDDVRHIINSYESGEYDAKK